ncbi:MAG: protein translocase subunit SecF [Candidatus Beckwithbacteria bacterium]|nr:protein translocase subunit SecF [Patescibacteria group bacterium]
MKYKVIYFIFSLIFLIPSAYFLINYGLKPAVDFTGGTILEIFITPKDGVELSPDSVTNFIKDTINLNEVQQINDFTFLIKAQQFDQEISQIVKQNIKTNLGEVEEKRFETIGPTMGKELIKKTLIGVFIAAGFIMVFVTSRFKDKKYGVCAILAMLHDTFITIGIFSYLGVTKGVEVDALFVTAVLTILSFSVHDTIVVYDRIRESIKLYPKLSYTDLVNKAVTETLGRSINNSITIIFMLLALYLLGGVTTKWFVFALLIGTISGTYSSTFTAAPLLVLWEQKKNKYHTSKV